MVDAASMFGWKYKNWVESLSLSGVNFITGKDILKGGQWLIIKQLKV